MTTPDIYMKFHIDWYDCITLTIVSVLILITQQVFDLFTDPMKNALAC
jgi:hypothetical protein